MRLLIGVLMKIKLFICVCFLSCFSLFGSVDNSIIGLMNQRMIRNLDSQLNDGQRDALESVFPHLDKQIRIMSFNMLLNYSESHLETPDRWVNRKGRVIEYVRWAAPDVIGSQELQANQLDDLLAALGDEYGFYGVGVNDGLRKGDIPAIFYRKERLELIEGRTLYFSETPEVMSANPFGRKNTFTFCRFLDKKSGQEFCVLNTHLAFGDCRRRHYEASKMREYLLEHQWDMPLILTGDFNTFPFRQELDLPFYDGDAIMDLLETDAMRDSMKRALFGHFGPLSSTNYSSEKKRAFCCEGEPGVILDHIFVNKGILVLSHGIDPAKVDGRYPSDHLPVVMDFLIRERCSACD